MSTVANEPNLVELPNLRRQESSAEANSTRSRRQSERIITAAEVIGDFAAAAIGLILAYGSYHLLGLGKDIVYPLHNVVGLNLVPLL